MNPLRSPKYSRTVSPASPAVLGVLVACFAFLAQSARGEDPSFTNVANEVNKKLVKLYGSGGFRGLPAYGTGILVSPQGHILTVASHILDTQDLRVHLHDGRRYHAKVLVIEPELDAALVKINDDNLNDLPYFDVSKTAQTPVAQTGDWILAFSNQFQIATRDEPMSIQRGVIAAYAKLHGRRGVFEAPYTGEVYVIDAITNGPGAGGGAVTTRKGELVGIIGKELRNTLSETWVNYAMPIQVVSKALPDKKGSFVELAMRGEWKAMERKRKEGAGGYHGIVLVPNVVLERTPAYVEDVDPGSPAAKAGIKPDDLIAYVDGEQVISIESFRKIMDSVAPDTELTLEVRRADKSEPGAGDKLVTIKLKMGKAVAKAATK